MRLAWRLQSCLKESANVFTFKRSKNCNFLFLCQTGSRAARFGGSLDPVAHDIILITLPISST